MDALDFADLAADFFIMGKVKIVVDMTGERANVYVSRVPVVGEYIRIRATAYVVRTVYHNTNGEDDDHAVAEILVTLPAKI